MATGYIVVGDSTDYESVPGGGAAYVYKRQGATWLLLDPPVVRNDLGEAFEDYFTYYGRAVAISKSGIIVGAPGKNDDDYQVGRAYFYPLPVDLGDTLNIPTEFAFFAEILFGIINGGGGVIVRPGGPRPMDPPRPDRWRRLPPSRRDVIMGMALTELATLIDDAAVRHQVKRAGADLTTKAMAKMAASLKGQSRTTQETRVDGRRWRPDASAVSHTAKVRVRHVLTMSYSRRTVPVFS